MKKYSLILLMLSFIVVTLASFTINNNEPTIENVNSFSDYCDGWESGHCEGWRDVKGQYAICPITPICPIAKIECGKGYKCGYNRGFKAGMKAARKN